MWFGSQPFTHIEIISEYLFLSLLAIVSIVLWTKHKRLGFNMLYLTILSLTVGYIILLNIPYLFTEDGLIPITHPHIQATMTLTGFIIPLLIRRSFVFLTLIPITLICIYYLFIYQIPLFSIIGGLFIGGFISYAFFKSQDWMGAMPDPYLLAFAIVIPIAALFFIYPEMPLVYLPGVMLGAGVGTGLETLKIRMSISSSNLRNKIVASGLGLFGIILGYLLYSLHLFDGPFPSILLGIVTGLWITFFVPYLSVLLGFYGREGFESHVF
ncbi:hypothetical protein [Salisediminibacterium selenitireducens]|uniref:Uncharacterized protein n=1 Tax=Bacillus selenitireducens (strain ATCC 700615 / DSM 15326 / MLS10) TaxID=439292 RepID=D6XW29_BACIE|nr:hypothetical protein [Salisediminibacterium selenitireducens]ADH99783.1 hypothetical protein Bsel_2280 [[Bacillus] selenitireducens MLS10]